MAYYFSTAPLNDIESKTDSNLRFVGLPQADDFSIYRPIIRVSYGFSISADQKRLILKPLVINGNRSPEANPLILKTSRVAIAYIRL